jgi:hypothetical protein
LPCPTCSPSISTKCQESFLRRLHHCLFGVKDHDDCEPKLKAMSHRHVEDNKCKHPLRLSLKNLCACALPSVLFICLYSYYSTLTLMAGWKEPLSCNMKKITKRINLLSQPRGADQAAYAHTVKAHACNPYALHESSRLQARAAAFPSIFTQ